MIVVFHVLKFLKSFSVSSVTRRLSTIGRARRLRTFPSFSIRCRTLPLPPPLATRRMEPPLRIRHRWRRHWKNRSASRTLIWTYWTGAAAAQSRTCRTCCWIRWKRSAAAAPWGTMWCWRQDNRRMWQGAIAIITIISRWGALASCQRKRACTLIIGAVLKVCPQFGFCISRVGDPDPHVFGSLGSGSISQRYGSRSFPFLK